MPQELLTPPEAAARLRLSVHTLKAWRRDEKGPPKVKIGRRVFYDAADLEQYIEDRKS